MAKREAKAVILGSPCPTDSHLAVWFDLDEEGRPDRTTVEQSPVACWVTYKFKNETRVGGMVLGPGGLYLAELEDEDFRCYAAYTEEIVADVAKAVDFWEEEMFAEVEEEEEDPDSDEDDDSGEEE